VLLALLPQVREHASQQPGFLEKEAKRQSAARQASQSALESQWMDCLEGMGAPTKESRCSTQETAGGTRVKVTS
jgi:hypothetical protein